MFNIKYISWDGVGSAVVGDIDGEIDTDDGIIGETYDGAIGGKVGDIVGGRDDVVFGDSIGTPPWAKGTFCIYIYILYLCYIYTVKKTHIRI